MKGEWPVLLDIMGKGEGDERYLSVAEVRTLFVERRSPTGSSRACPRRRVVDDHLNSGVPGTKASNAAQNCAR